MELRCLGIKCFLEVVSAFENLVRLAQQFEMTD